MQLLLNQKTRNGVFLLKKHNFSGLQVLKACGLVVLVLFIVCVSGCKSVPEASFVNPLDVMDGKSSFYLRIPASVDSVLLEQILKGKFKGISDSDASKIIDHIDTVYIGLNRSRKGVDYQISLSCNFPQIYVKSAFTKKNGWESDLLTLTAPDGKPRKYTVYQGAGTLVSFPSESLACFGRNVPAMVEKYHNLSLSSDNIPAEDPVSGDVYSWLSYDNGIPDDEIHFFADKPQSFLTMLTGAQLNYQLAYVRGRMYNDSKNDKQYIMQLEFEFKDKRMVQAAKGALSLAFGLTDSELTRDSDTHITVSNIKISKAQLYKILVI